MIVSVTRDEARAVYNLLEDANINQLGQGTIMLLRETRGVRESYFSDENGVLDLTGAQIRDVLSDMWDKGWSLSEDKTYGPIYEKLKSIILDIPTEKR